MMRVPILATALMLWVCSPGYAEPLKVAAFDFELLDTSLQGAVNGAQPDEQRLFKYVTDQLRKTLGQTGNYVILDIGLVNAAAHASNLQAFGISYVQFAQRL